MPGLNGDDVYREIRRASTDTPVLASSGYTEREGRRRFCPGIAGFLQKPFTLKRLAAAVQAAIPSSPAAN